MDKSPFNLFEESGKSKKPKKDEKKPEETPISVPKFKAEMDPNLPVPTDEEAQLLIAQMKKIHDDINDQLESIFRRTGWTMKDIQTYLDDPAHFTHEEWKLLQANRLAMLTPLADAMGKKPDELQKRQRELSEKKASKERRGRTVGSRRNWLSTR